MDIEFEVSQVRALAADLTKASTSAQLKAGQVVRKAGADLERIAKQRAPVDTGNLRNSIGTTAHSPTSVEVGPTASYAAYVELGTYKMAAQPYMGPATDAVEPLFVAAMEKIGGEIL